MKITTDRTFLIGKTDYNNTEYFFWYIEVEINDKKFCVRPFLDTPKEYYRIVLFLEIFEELSSEKYIENNPVNFVFEMYLTFKIKVV